MKGPGPAKAIRVVGPVVYVHRAGCPAEDTFSFQARADGHVWRCCGCGVRVGWGRRP